MNGKGEGLWGSFEEGSEGLVCIVITVAKPR